MDTEELLTFRALREANVARCKVWHPTFGKGLDLAPLVERVRVASFEAPRANSGTEWEARIRAILADVAAGADWIGSDWSNAAAGEMGEACNIVKKLRRAETNCAGAIDPDVAVLRSKLGDEIADAVTYLDLLAQFYGINMAEAVVRKFNAISVRESLPHRLPEAAA